MQHDQGKRKNVRMIYAPVNLGPLTEEKNLYLEK